MHAKAVILIFSTMLKTISVFDVKNVSAMEMIRARDVLGVHVFVNETKKENKSDDVVSRLR